MADERIEIEIVLDDGSIKRGFAKIKKQAKSTAKETEKAFKNSFASLESAAFKLGAAFAVALSIKKVTDEFVKFERALIGVAKTTNILGIELELLGRDIQDISARIPVATNELLRLAQVAGQFGVRGNQDILKFVETVAKLQFTIEGIDTEEAAKSLTRILNVTKQGIGNIDRLASSLVALGNRFEATEGEIINIGNEVTRSTAAFGVLAQDALALGTALKAVGVQAESGGTAVGRVFQEIALALANGGDKLKQFSRITGLSAKQLKKDFGEDAIGVFQKFINGVARTSKGSVELTKTFARLGLRQQRVLKSIIPLVNANQKLTRTLKVSRQAFEENTALNIEFARVNATLSAKLQIFENQVTRLAVALGEVLGPTLRANIQFFTDLTKAASSFVDRNFGSSITKELAKIDQEIEGLSDRIRTLQRDTKGSGTSGLFGDFFSLPESLTGPQITNLNTQLLELVKRRDELLKRAPTTGPEGAADPDDPLGTEVLMQKVSTFAEALTLTGELFAQTTSGFFSVFTDELFNTVTLTEKGLEQMNKAFNKQLAGGISKSVQVFVSALTAGKNAFEALGKAILGILGDLAIQVGTFLIATGIAQTAVLSAPGGPVIAVGIGLVALGTLLKAIGGSGFAATDGGGGGGGAIGTSFVSDEDIGEDEFEEKITQVQIDVSGQVLNPLEVGNQIAQVLNDAFEAGGTKVVTA